MKKIQTKKVIILMREQLDSAEKGDWKTFHNLDEEVNKTLKFISDDTGT